MIRALAVFLALTVACAKAPTVPPTLVDSSKWVETEALPLHPKTLPLPAGMDADSEKMVVPIEEGMCDSQNGAAYAKPCPEFSGIAVSEARAVRDGMYRIQYDELRARYEADRNVWAAHRMLYETQMQRDAEHIKTLAPTWWELHDGQITGSVGFGIGAAIVLGCVKAVTKTTGN